MPLTHTLIYQIQPFLKTLPSLKPLYCAVDDEELKLWKEVRPAMVERCRDWEHRASCEYRRSQIPVSVEDGESPICSCGRGKIPPNFIQGVPEWDMVAKHVTRVAISPTFSVPFIEDLFLHENLSAHRSFLDGVRTSDKKNDSRTSSGEKPDTDGCQKCGKEKSANGTKTDEMFPVSHYAVFFRPMPAYGSSVRIGKAIKGYAAPSER